MHTEVFPTDEWAARVADVFEERVRGARTLRMSLPSGRTPQPLYDELVRRAVDMSSVELFQLDEFGGLPADHPARCEGMLRRDLLDRLPRPPTDIHLIDVESPDVDAAAAAYDEAVAASGLDLVVLGLGANGHVALNEPGAAPDTPTRVVGLAPQTMSSAADYGDAAEVPTWGVTLGMQAILAAREVWLLVTGAGKRDILRRVVGGPVSPEVPATLLSLNPNATIYADAAAATR